jgi:16S rRNA (uracil1498-N3)-methyltransferase
LRGDEAHHLTRVLRVEVGHTYEISDGEWLYLAQVDAAHKSLVSFEVKEKHAIPPERCSVTLCLALFKFDAFEWALEKAAELGANVIQPFWCDRSEHGLEKAAPKRAERWQKILLEASQQCRRPLLPRLEPSVKFEQALQAASAHCYFCDEERSGAPFEPVIDDSLALMIGPEGGWTDRERTAAKAAGWQSVSLGPRILRAETAAAAGLAIAANAILKTDPR